MRKMVVFTFVVLLLISMVQWPIADAQEGQAKQLFKTAVYLKTGGELKPELPDEGQTAERKNAQKDITTFPPGGNGIITDSRRTNVGDWNGDSLTSDLVWESAPKFVFWASNGEDTSNLDYDFWIDIYSQPSGEQVYQTPEGQPFTVTMNDNPRMVEFNLGGNGSSAVRVDQGESLMIDLDFRSNRDVAVYYDGEQDGQKMLSYLEIECNGVEMLDVKASKSDVKFYFKNAFNSQLYWKLEIDGVPVQGTPMRETDDGLKFMKWSVSSSTGKHNAVIKVSYEPFVSSTGNETNGTFYSFLHPYSVKDSEEEGLLSSFGLPGFEGAAVAAAVGIALILRRRRG